MSNKSCQTNYTEFTPIVTSIQVKGAKINKKDYDDYDDYDEECDCNAIECCCMCIWYLGAGSLLLALIYYSCKA